MDTNRQRTLQCIIDLNNANRVASRQLVASMLNLKVSAVDEAVKRLREDGLVRTLVQGVLEAIPQFPPDRPMSRTTLPDGMTIIEVGDSELRLTPHEAQVMGKMLMGDAMQLSYWAAEREQGAQIVRLETQVRDLQQRLKGLNHRLSLHHRTRGQKDLFSEEDERNRRPVPA